jgi:aquaporin Z
MNILGKLADDYQSGSIGAEFLGFGILMLTVVATTENKVSKSGSGIAVGGALLAGLLMSKGILNPAVAIAMGEGLSPAGWITPISGIVPCLLFSLFERARPPKTES